MSYLKSILFLTVFLLVASCASTVDQVEGEKKEAPKRTIPSKILNQDRN